MVERVDHLHVALEVIASILALKVVVDLFHTLVVFRLATHGKRK